MVKSCRTCRSCRRIEEFNQIEGKVALNDVTGVCVRYPPQIVAANQSAYPPVKLDGWPCDEWKK